MKRPNFEPLFMGFCPILNVRRCKSVKYPTLIRPIKEGLYSIASLLLDKYVHANPNEIEIDSQNSSDIRERRSVLMVAITPLKI